MGRNRKVRELVTVTFANGDQEERQVCYKCGVPHPPSPIGFRYERGTCRDCDVEHHRLMRAGLLKKKEENICFVPPDDYQDNIRRDLNPELVRRSGLEGDVTLKRTKLEKPKLKVDPHQEYQDYAQGERSMGDDPVSMEEYIDHNLHQCAGCQEYFDQPGDLKDGLCLECKEEEDSKTW